MNDITSELAIYAPAVQLDAFISRRKLRVLRRSVSILTLLCACIVFGYVLRDSILAQTITYESVYTDARIFTGLFFIFLAPLTLLFQLSFFYNTLYFRGTESTNSEDFADAGGITLPVARVLTEGKDDLTAAFCQSNFGKEVLFRCGISYNEILLYLKLPRQYISSAQFPLTKGVFLTLRDVGTYVFATDASFKEFLFKNGMSSELYQGTLEWIFHIDAKHRQKKRWWSRDNLGRIQGIGGEFSYGVAYDLKRYMRDINTTAMFSLMSNESAYAQEIITKIESILTRGKSANVLLVAEPGVGEMDILVALGKKMKEGKSVASVIGKRLVVFDASTFTGVYGTKKDFEYAFLKLMLQAEEAGNIILVIEDVASFLANLETLQIDASALLERFLSSSFIQIIGTTNPKGAHQYLGKHGELMQHFETVQIEHPDLSSTIRFLEDALWKYEKKHKAFFTYPALVRIAESADQYIVDGVMPDKAMSFLAEVASRAGTLRATYVTPDFVNTVVTSKTGIPIGPVLEHERELLIHLEDRLHERVIGQADAIKVIASTMRRSRAGIQSKERPIGSFLFLGSTGVGKTETAKALAHVFFGSEEKMIRFDMSEFSDAGSLEHLLGTSSESGVLATTLHDRPYGVLLLDEFEKASGEVHDLFLQILDEGYFTDSQGRRINARNTIIIATSNAGSDRIYEIVRRGERPTLAKDTIIDAIIRNGIFKPELVNRFDNVVIFESLSELQQKKIAELMLGELKERIRKRGFELELNEAIVDIVTKEGSDPEFGARPMRRAIQDIIEEKIALRILEERLRPGDTIRLERSDFS